jgi:hypothetical protein
MSTFALTFSKSHLGWLIGVVGITLDLSTYSQCVFHLGNISMWVFQVWKFVASNLFMTLSRPILTIRVVYRMNACYNVNKKLSQFDNFQSYGTLIYHGGYLKNIL